MNTDTKAQTAIEDRPSNRMSSAELDSRIKELDKVKARLQELLEMEYVRERNKELVTENQRQAHTIEVLSSESVSIKKRNSELQRMLQAAENTIKVFENISKIKDKEIAKLRRNTRRTRR